ncbi:MULTISPECIES: hypothetical protein [Microbacterium]|uniref:hypothetical protein n=1 Tax=Microbacterium TaxID=33882 RepID=UPI000C36C282|nr:MULTISPECIES: hypothetical protein [Microbacterium]MAB19832.1 hypothetical protein [Microbacterium sp.]MAM54752.1 hypothetical protein [Microbacterium sp.]MAY48723.1 hypothetical protein [Microbacterium sp.]HAS30787.1 hypothetical protein [Microbacterium sp.]HBR88733.1 hypothetical protein [Microbacterium sp.]
MTDEQYDDTTEVPERTTPAGESTVGEEAAGPYGVGPFSIREVALGGVWLVAFVVSFFSVTVARFDSVWTSGLLWIITIGLPTAAVFLLALRRLSPQGIRRVGSLGIDQFASVVFSFAALLWLQMVWETVAVAIDSGLWLRSWVVWVELVLMLAGVVLTVFAPLIPVFAADFHDRPEVPAHRNARPVRAVVPRPARPSAPAPAAAPAADDTAPGAGWTGAAEDDAPSDRDDDDLDVFTPRQTRDTFEAVEPGETVESERSVRQQAFWALVPEERDVLDETGAPLFRIGPTAWALVIEDRGEVFVVRDEDGRVGYLHEVDGVTRG